MRAEKVCEKCGAEFTVPNYRRDTARFCSASCKSSDIAKKHLNKGPKPWAAKNLDGHRHKSPTRFKAGHKTWNAGMKGLQLSPETQFKPGQVPQNKVAVGSVAVRKCKEHLRAFVKTAEPSEWTERAKVVWQQHNGPIPSGYVIHHKDRDTLNDDISNLQAMTRAEHINEHRDDLLKK